MSALFNMKFREAIAWTSDECRSLTTIAQLIDSPCVRLIAHLFHGTVYDVAEKVVEYREDEQ